MFNNYSDCTNFISNIPKFSKEVNLSKVSRLLDLLAPSLNSKIIHVAGTNGKGSVCKYISSILISSGYKVGLFTSPHLVSMNERISLNNENISEEDFVRICNRVYEVSKKTDDFPTFFEFLFLMGMAYFCEKDTDYIVLETGMGGRLDATNSIRNKVLCVITKIGLDHTKYLGDTIEKIAFEKAGIIKEDTPVVFWDNEDESTRVIKDVADSKNSTCYSINRMNIGINGMTKEIIDFHVKCGYYRYDSLIVGTCALYQIYNASLSVLAVKALGDERISDASIKEGLYRSFWPGRMEKIRDNVYLDGAHNPDGIKAFLESVRVLKTEGKRYLLFAAAKDKSYDEMIDLIVDSGLFDKVMAAPFDNSRSLKTDELVKAFDRCSKLDAYVCSSVEEAYEKALLNMNPKDELFIAGSLYLAGKIRALAD